MRRSALARWRSPARSLLPAGGRRPDVPGAQGPGQDRAQAQGPVQDAHGLQEEELQVPQDPGGGQRGQGGRQDPRQERRLQGVRADQRPQEALPAARRQPQEARQGRARRAATRRQNGVFVNDADEVTIDGFTARDYKANGFFVTNAVGYTLTNLRRRPAPASTASTPSTPRAARCRTRRRTTTATRASTSGRRRSRPSRSARWSATSTSWGNPIGFSATNMRYVTITRAASSTTASGIVPNALDSEKFPPAEDNVITDNDIFWNNFNFHEGAPFKPKKTGVVPLVPIGTGVLLLGGQRNRVEGNRIFGNYLVGAAAVEGILLAGDTRGARARGQPGHRQPFGLGGEDLNGRDLAYDGNGTGNCWGPNDGVRATQPADPAMFPACPFDGANTFSQAAQDQLLGLAGPNAADRLDQVAAQGAAGTRSRWRCSRSDASPCSSRSRCRARRGAGQRGPRARPSSIVDNYYAPDEAQGRARTPRSRGAGPTRPATSTTSSSRRARRASRSSTPSPRPSATRSSAS